jgi:hypothetical protein
VIEALAAALLLGAISTMLDAAAAQLELHGRPTYLLARTLAIGFCIGGIVGARARQFVTGVVSGLFPAALAAAIYFGLTPTIGIAALALAWIGFWAAFCLLDAMLGEGISPSVSLVLGVAAAVISGAAFQAIASGWVEQSRDEPNLPRALVLWTATFLPGFVALCWRR